MSDTNAQHLKWLREITALPTAAGREQRVIAWIRDWVSERKDLVLEEDEAGNLIIHRQDMVDDQGERPLYVTAHLDHPAFVVEERLDEGRVRLSFRGTVRDPYFTDGRINLFLDDGQVIPATIISTQNIEPLRQCEARLDMPYEVPLGTVGTWDLPDQHIDDEGVLHTNACDDLAAVAAALCAMDSLREQTKGQGIHVLLTRAEEVGFIGATASCKLGWIPKGAQMLTLENSRSFPDSPLGAGPIVRVGDKVSTFSPELTAAVAQVAADLTKSCQGFKYQRKLMPGGTCEATVFFSYGYDATCVCLPLGNYHNQGDLTRVELESPQQAAVGLEYISIADFNNLVKLLVRCGEHLSEASPYMKTIEMYYEQVGWVVERPAFDS